MAAKYLIWEEDYSEEHADFENPTNLSRVYMNVGRDVASVMPSEAVEMFQKAGTGRAIPDFISTVFCLLVSAPLRSTLEHSGVEGIQYFPAVLKSEKGKVLSEGHSIANVIALCDCVDEETSEFSRSQLQKRNFSTMFKIVLREDAIDPGLKLFRLDRYSEILLVREGLAETIAGRFTGSAFQTLEEYNRAHKKEW
jgi:hypothetical protein